MSFLAARSVKRTLRRSIYEKLLRLGPAYSQNMAKMCIRDSSSSARTQSRHACSFSLSI